MEQRTFIVDENGEDLRIDKYLALLMEDCSRSYIQKIIGDQSVTVNGKSVKANYKVGIGDAVEIQIPDPVILDIHRIDKDTTGVLVICKNDKAHRAVAEQLAVHSITRAYHAIVYNNIKEDEGTVDAPIGRMDADRKKMGINRKNGRHAVTHYRVLERFGRYTYIECRLETGRTHQIRVHMASIGHPLLGDTVYGPSKDPFKLEGQALHAKLLGFQHPTTGQYVEFESPLPDYFTALLNKLRQTSGNK